MQENFYQYQHRRLGILLTWGLGSIVTGLLTLLSRDTLWRQFGLQAITWGAIDAIITLFGRRIASNKAVAYTQGQVSPANEQRDARNFRLVLLVNAVLDLCYVLGGTRLMQKAGQRRDRSGVGLGIIIQGLWLLFYDGLLTIEVGQRWQQVD